MPMNRLHRWLCRSELWARGVERHTIPWTLEGVDLGADVLEIGPGYGATTRVLVRRAPRLTALELDAALAAGLRERHGDAVQVVHGDGTRMPLADARFSGVVCFTMLHHVPTPGSQDQIFAEAHRVLRPGGVFAGADDVHSLGFRLAHLGDTYMPIDPDTLGDRLYRVGFADIRVTLRRGTFRFRARKRAE
ncbi:Methyltransferase domain-containing protein [Streptoalloteichus tenebrarius]|uniref:Methyltransferase domain-containing protein n=1 Tax=Streptoalloteichus tenebrarius (strain ATCC 17920 / DSM 40477 / JCM 4838 / CBS 697.72 / NBRC 16177 / NCIMB 11028 / NRRL B-12390 / A12253. 1 / ISP 5477) TaxID=1933 RepID=A0ABT1I1S9_STRSD|nr:class I SAM-dependent methyltransferase [Streptoalloteichus tenebrarius]MCP2261741.1 Methyltransferase domain-containing protein [Streptoalloteichus tenebrarius]